MLTPQPPGLWVLCTPPPAALSAHHTSACAFYPRTTVTRCAVMEKGWKPCLGEGEALSTALSKPGQGNCAGLILYFPVQHKEAAQSNHHHGKEMIQPTNVQEEAWDGESLFLVVRVKSQAKIVGAQSREGETHLLFYIQNSDLLLPFITCSCPKPTPSWEAY